MEATNETSSNQASETSYEATSSAGAVEAAGSGVQSPEATNETGGEATQEGKAVAAAGAESAWTPNFKFTVKDKALEFDDFIKPIVKNKELETKIREMYEKAYGIDEVKSVRDTFKTQAEEWKGKYGQVEQSLQTLGGYVKKGDFRTFFQALNIPKDKIIQYAIEELKYQDLPADQRAALEQQRQSQAEFEQAQQQNQMLQTQMQQMAVQQATFELDQALNRPDAVQVAQAYDARAGKLGAFKAEVIRRGQYYEAVHKISPPASQLVAEVLNLVGVQAQAQQGSQATSIGTPSQVVQAQKDKPVIPAFQGGGAKSPAAKIPTSIDDLRKMREQLTT